MFASPTMSPSSFSGSRPMIFSAPLLTPMIVEAILTTIGMKEMVWTCFWTAGIKAVDRIMCRLVQGNRKVYVGSLLFTNC